MAFDSQWLVQVIIINIVPPAWLGVDRKCVFYFAGLNLVQQNKKKKSLENVVKRIAIFCENDQNWDSPQSRNAFIHPTF